jgi:hypothetical protein
VPIRARESGAGGRRVARWMVGGADPGRDKIARGVGRLAGVAGTFRRSGTRAQIVGAGELRKGISEFWVIFQPSE